MPDRFQRPIAKELRSHALMRLALVAQGTDSPTEGLKMSVRVCRSQRCTWEDIERVLNRRYTADEMREW